MFKRLLKRSRTFQLRHFGSYGGLRLGLPVWCLVPLFSDRPDDRMAGEVCELPGQYTRGVVGIRIFRESPLGTNVVTTWAPLSKIEYRSPGE